MKQRKVLTSVGLIAISTLIVTSCGGDGDPDFDPASEPVDTVVHTGPGGGNDVFARSVNQNLSDLEMISDGWTVNNVDGGSGSEALSHMSQQAGNEDVIAAVSMTWLTTPLTMDGDMVSLTDMTPIAQIMNEPRFLAVRADSPYETVQDLVQASQAGEQITHTGGSQTGDAAIVGEQIQREIGADWRFLSFPGGGERIAALLGGDADLMIAAAEGLDQYVNNGDVRLLAVVEDDRFETYPDVPSLSEEGVDIDVFEQVLGYVGPPDMEPDVVQLYEDLFRELDETEEWHDFLLDNGWVGDFMPATEWSEKIDALEDDYEEFLEDMEIEAS